MATDLEIALIVVAAVLLLSLLCTCCCWRCQSDKKDAHVRTGAQRRAAMDAYWRTHGEDREPAGVKRTEGYVLLGLACLLCYSAVCAWCPRLEATRALLVLITSVTTIATAHAPPLHSYVTNSRGMVQFTQLFEPTDRQPRGLICFCHGCVGSAGAGRP